MRLCAILNGTILKLYVTRGRNVLRVRDIKRLSDLLSISDSLFLIDLVLYE